MIKQLTVLLLILSNTSIAQNKPQPTQFDKFINKPGIQWAAYASDTFNFYRADLNNRLLNRLTKKEIKASLPLESRTTSVNNIKYIPLDSINSVYFEASTGMDNMIDTARFLITEITQILYVEKGILKSYIPFVTPALPVYLSSGKYLGESFYFNTAYNYKYNRKFRKKNKLIFLGQTKSMLKNDQAQSKDQLKTMYGKNLLETLWPYVLEDKIEVFSVESNSKLKPGDLNINLAYVEPQVSPIYDSVGNIVKYQVSAPEDGTARFTEVQLVQDWYYDHKRNRIYALNKEMIVYTRKPASWGDKEPAPVFKLVFK
ncbi:MAG: hypothetical protein IPL50_18035 [Chitinophagaceae bacterium]|nr:hypothetical protein [Chitinophagaceae bacterium]